MPDFVFQAIPPDLRSGVPRPSDAARNERVACRFLATHAFANWAVHLSAGLDAWLYAIACASSLLDAGFDVRQADLILRHLVDPRRLADACAASTRRP